MANLNDILRVAVRMGGNTDQDIMNIWTVKLVTLVDGDDEDVADDIVQRIGVLYQDLEDAISSDQYSKDISIQNITSGQVLGTHEWTTPFLGAAGGDSMPPQTSLFSYFRTGYSRRIGRKFWGILTETLQDAGLSVPAVATTMATFLVHWIISWVGAVTGNTYEWGVYNENKIPDFVPFQEAVSVGRLMTQRRRRPTVGS